MTSILHIIKKSTSPKLSPRAKGSLTYHNCITKWANGWKAGRLEGWTRKGDEIKNLDIIKPAHALYLTIADRIEVQHVSAHIGIEGNELADRMSVVAIELQETELCQYTESLSIPDILSMTRG